VTVARRWRNDHVVAADSVEDCADVLALGAASPERNATVQGGHLEPAGRGDGDSGRAALGVYMHQVKRVREDMAEDLSTAHDREFASPRQEAL